MKKVLFAIASLVVIFSLSINFTSCRNHDEEGDTTKLNSVSVDDAAYSAIIYTDVVSEVLVDADAGEDSSKSFMETCANITLDPTVGYPKTLTIDYGTSGCDLNGHTVKGTITATISDKIRTEGSKVSVSFTNFSIDTVTVNGTFTLVINSVNLTDATIAFTTDFSGCSLSMPSGTISLDGAVSYEWNMKTLTDYSDDIFSITSANLTGTNRDGKSYTMQVQTPLVFPVECGTITSGTVDVQTSDSSYPATIDFGDGTCDKTATVTTTIEITVGDQTFYKTVTYEITLP